MSDEIVCRIRTTASQTALVAMAMLGLFIGIALTCMVPAALTHNPNAGHIQPILLLVGVAILIASVAGLLLATVRAPDNPIGLIIGAQGLTDYRSEYQPEEVPWVQIQSLDTEITTYNGVVSKATLYLYVITPTGRVETIEVRLDGLDQGPKKLAREVKRRWMEARLQHGPYQGEDEYEQYESEDEHGFRER
jgi:hypothetical protein